MWRDKVVAFFRKSIQDGTFNRNLDKVQFITIEKGRIVAEMPLAKDGCNPMNSLHGGMSATLVDTMSSMALRAHFEAQNSPPPHTVSIELSLSFLSAIPENNTIRIETETIRVGRNIAFLMANLYNKETNKLAVTGKHTKFLMF